MADGDEAVPDAFDAVFARDYPDVVGAGSLLDAVRAEAERAGYGLTVEHVLPDVLPYDARRVTAQVVAGVRLARITLTHGGRDFHLFHRDGGRSAAGGRTPDLSAATAAMHGWLRGIEVRELIARWPFLRVPAPSGWPPADDTAPGNWRKLRTDVAVPRRLRVQDLVEAAHREPRLRALSPGLSHDWLRFRSGTTGPGHARLPLARPLGGGRYQVRTADGLLQEAADAAGAVGLLLAALPDDPPEP